MMLSRSRRSLIRGVRRERCNVQWWWIIIIWWWTKNKMQWWAWWAKAEAWNDHEIFEQFKSEKWTYLSEERIKQKIIWYNMHILFTLCCIYERCQKRNRNQKCQDKPAAYQESMSRHAIPRPPTGTDYDYSQQQNQQAQLKFFEQTS